MAKRVTIVEVAKRADVSTATVSRAIAGSPLVAADVRDRVLRTAKRIGYSPRPASKQSDRRPNPLRPKLDIVLFDMQKDHHHTTDFFGQMIHGVQMESYPDGKAQLAIHSSESSVSIDELTESLSQSDGLMLMGHIEREPGLFDHLVGLGKPVLLVGRRVAGRNLNAVISEDFTGCSELVDYLFNLGFRRFGWLGGPVGIQHIADRLSIIRGCLASKGVEILPKDCLNPSSFKAETVLECIDKWIDAGDLPEVIISATGRPVVLLQRALASHGLSCPDDLSIVCFDNSDFTQYCHPVPTRMATFPEEMGRWAYRRLLNMVKDGADEAPVTIQIPMRLIEGESVKPPSR